MKTTSTVNSKKNGTLKMKKDNYNLRNLLAGLFFSCIALAGMSFTTDDTTKIADSVTKNKVQTQDSCCVVVITNDRLVITGNNLATEVKHLVNNLSLEKLIAKNFMQLSFSEISFIDNRMDINFRTSERKNIEMAVAYKNILVNEAYEADSQLSENMMRSAFAPVYSKNLLSEMELADETIDEMLFEEAELATKTRAYKSGLTSQIALADENIDQMLNISTLKTIEQSSIESADRLMDAQIQKSALRNINKSLAADADLKMDELIIKN